MITVDEIQRAITTEKQDEGLSVRGVRPDDGRAIREMFGRSSRDTIYYRFHIPWPTVPDWAIDLLVDDTKSDRRVVVATDGEKVVGHAMYVRDDVREREAEAALMVEDDYQSRGTGRSLLHEISELARQDGIETLTCTTLESNYRLLSVLKRSFPERRVKYSDGACLIRLPL